MRKDYGPKANIYPMPVLIVATYDENHVPDAMNAGWGGISGEHEISMGLSPAHKTVKNILARKAFTVSMGEAGFLKACDYVGLVSGEKVPDKLERSGFTTTKSKFVDAPVINELSVCVECILKSYDPETQRMTGEIVNASVDERVLTDGKVDLSKAHILTLDPYNMTYRVIGEEAGKAFHDGNALK